MRIKLDKGSGCLPEIGSLEAAVNLTMLNIGYSFLIADKSFRQ